MTIRCTVCKIEIDGVAVFGPAAQPLCWQHWRDALYEGERAVKAAEPARRQLKALRKELETKRGKLEDEREEMAQTRSEIDDLTMSIDELASGETVQSDDYVEAGIQVLLSREHAAL
jgi:septal ring factor EnvC (AmiA/AmiB activator)